MQARLANSTRLVVRLLNLGALILAGATTLWAAETAPSAAQADDELAPIVTVGGLEIQTAQPPQGLVLCKDLGILASPLAQGQIIYRTATRLLETRATITPGGDWLLMFPEGQHYGSAKGRKVNDMLAFRSSDQGRTWQGPTIAFGPEQNHHGFIPFIPKGSRRIYAFGTQPIPGKYDWQHGQAENAPIGYRWSDDDGRTWSDVVLIRPTNDPDFRGMSVMRMCETERGTWLLGSHAADWSVKPLTTRQYLLRSEDQGQTWTVLPDKRPNGWFAEGFSRMDEGRPIALGGDRVLALFRTPEGHLWAARSNDDGRTWTPPAPTPLVHPDAPPMLFHLADGKTLVAFHHNRHSQREYTGLQAKMEGMKDRAELWVSLSRDEGRTWSKPRFVLANALAPNTTNMWQTYQCSYADLLVDGDSLHLFLPHRWRCVLHVTLKAGDLEELPTKTELTAKANPSVLPPSPSPAGASEGSRARPSSLTVEADVCIYGGTSGGVVAAVQAARMGKRVLLLEPGRHLGGMTSGGLSAVDIGDPRSVGGIAREYFTRLVGAYGKTLAWDKPFVSKGGGPATGGAFAIEPHTAERLFDAMAAEAGVQVCRDARLATLRKQGPRIVELVLDDGRTVRATMFIDATYEGDLMAKAGVSYTLIREGNAQYGETYNGIHYSEKYQPRLEHAKPGPTGRTPSGQGVWDRDLPLDPYVVPGDPASGLLPLIQPGEPGIEGEPAPGVQAYCFRLCLTTREDRLPIAPPADYDPKRYEIVARFIAGCLAIGDDMDLRWFSKHDPLPNEKWDFNTATFGGNLPGASWEWPEASYARRAAIAKEHEDYHRGLLHFLATDERVPEKVRQDMRRFGLPRDEFVDHGGWPHQIYVREARRMVSDLVMTEQHTFGRQVAADCVALGSYGTDTHEIRRIVRDGVVCREGKTATGRGGADPYPIGYGAIVPKPSECDNLLVTFALSASHTAFSSIRMEPVFMALSQSAATAACQAIDGRVGIQKVDYARLRQRLDADKQVLQWLPEGGRTGAKTAPPADAGLDGRRFDLVVVGGTPSGVACAVRAARQGLNVLLVNHTAHLGGMMTNGLMQWDALYAGRRTPLFSEVLAAIEDHYRRTFGPDSPDFKAAQFSQKRYPLGMVEPSVAEKVFTGLVASEPRIRLLLKHYPTAVQREGALLQSVTLREFDGPKSLRVLAAVFADATYEGDLAALAKAPYRVGREARDEYHEPHAGKIFTNIDHKKAPRDAVEGRLNIFPYSARQGSIDPESPFTADGAVQAYNYRFCLTNDPANRLEVSKPAGYRREEYVDYERKYLASSGGPNRKSHMNSPILPGENHAYPDGDWATRKKIEQRHLEFGLGLIYFLQNDESVPAAKRKAFREWGLPKDEYVDNHHVPYEMYVRETRRIVGRHVFSEHDNSPAPGLGRTPVHPDSIAITDWYMDSHSCTTESRPGYKYDGKLILTEESRPAQIPYRSLLPQGVDNLLVPVCLSATHVSWGAVRLEPVLIQTGEAAGFAAAQAVENRQTPAAIDPDRLVRTLVHQRVTLSFFNDFDTADREAWVPAVQYLGTKGFFNTYDARPNQALTAEVARCWAATLARLAAGTAYDATDAARKLPTETAEAPAVSGAQFLVLLRETLPAAVAQRAEIAAAREGLKASDPWTRGDACRLMFAIVEGR